METTSMSKIGGVAMVHLLIYQRNGKSPGAKIMREVDFSVSV
jgi:hypothetical protein